LDIQEVVAGEQMFLNRCGFFAISSYASQAGIQWRTARVSYGDEEAVV
jgi:hypothetical protein